jgi:hypothetical protein
MIEIRGEWSGIEGMGVAILQSLRPGAERAVLKAELLLVSETQKTLAGTRHGRTYEITKTGRIHIASAPGEAPAVLNNRLRQSITFTDPKWEGWTVSGEVGTNIVYARRMEFGGVHTVRKTVRVRIAGQWRTVKAGTVIRILPRPWMAPTVARVEPMIHAIFDSFGP